MALEHLFYVKAHQVMFLIDFLIEALKLLSIINNL